MEVVVDANGNDKKFPNIALVSFNPNSYIFIVMFAISKPLANPMLTLQFFHARFPLSSFSPPPPCAPRGLEKGGGDRKRGGKVDLLVVTLPSSSSSVGGGGDTKLAAEKRRGEGKGKGA